MNFRDSVAGAAVRATIMGADQLADGTPTMVVLVGNQLLRVLAADVVIAVDPDVYKIDWRAFIAKGMSHAD